MFVSEAYITVPTSSRTVKNLQTKLNKEQFGIAQLTAKLSLVKR